ncbi:ly6/PLAUR domain-containing protein 6B isoform X1 [Ranitomeya imitator]|uniref:ly6/PLAUR domain-containing protein 6B isoform X1 n=2 Tax=Ranitomeya imitator TaxID=111125 RepID=UPI0037E980C8
MLIGIKTSRNWTSCAMMMTPHLLLLCTINFITFKDCACAKNVNFHNVRPPLDPTPFPNSFKCFTCEKSADNYNCNRWAEDKWCPLNTHYCKTVHHFSSHGKSKSVTKKCATREECQNVGCRHHRDSGHMECISCCDGMICNVDVPTNQTNAVLNLMRSHRKSDAHRVTAFLPAAVASILVLVIL